MIEFPSLAGLASHLMSRTVSELSGTRRGLKRAAEAIERNAKDEIGFYQDAVGPFPAWAQLAESTEASKAAKGYPADAPLLATGEMQGSIQHEIGDWEAIIGSTDPKMIFHEFGTSRMPARPVMGPALYHNLELVQRLIGAAAAEGMYDGGKEIHPALGYDVVVMPNSLPVIP